MAEETQTAHDKERLRTHAVQTYTFSQPQGATKIPWKQINDIEKTKTNEEYENFIVNPERKLLSQLPATPTKPKCQTSKKYEEQQSEEDGYDFALAKSLKILSPTEKQQLRELRIKFQQQDAIRKGSITPRNPSKESIEQFNQQWAEALEERKLKHRVHILKTQQQARQQKEQAATKTAVATKIKEGLLQRIKKHDEAQEQLLRNSIENTLKDKAAEIEEKIGKAFAAELQKRYGHEGELEMLENDLQKLSAERVIQKEARKNLRSAQEKIAQEDAAQQEAAREISTRADAARDEYTSDETSSDKQQPPPKYRQIRPYKDTAKTSETRPTYGTSNSRIIQRENKNNYNAPQLAVRPHRHTHNPKRENYSRYNAENQRELSKKRDDIDDYFNKRRTSQKDISREYMARQQTKSREDE